MLCPESNASKAYISPAVSILKRFTAEELLSQPFSTTLLPLATAIPDMIFVPAVMLDEGVTASSMLCKAPTLPCFEPEPIEQFVLVPTNDDADFPTFEIWSDFGGSGKRKTPAFAGAFLCDPDQATYF